MIVIKITRKNLNQNEKSYSILNVRFFIKNENKNLK
jgi:hypothetical protein